MTPTYTRRYRRRASSSREVGMFKRESQREPAFFGESAHETFFQPATQMVQRKCGKCEEDDKKVQRLPEEKKEEEKKLQRVEDKKEEEKKVMRAEDKKEEEKLQRKPEKKEEEKVQRVGDKKEEEKVMKMEDKKEEEKLQKKEGSSPTPGKGVHSYISSLNGKGNPLQPQANYFFSSKMGYDFSNVKIHNDKQAAESAKNINAKAYTIGNNVVFNEGQYNTESGEGKKLIAHELTHVVQQANASPQVKKIVNKSFVTKNAAKIIQRVPIVLATPAHETNNLANTVIHGIDVGETLALINGNRIRTEANVRAALRKPTLRFTRVPAGGFDARVNTSPLNIFSYDETVLARPPWRLNLRKSTVLGRFPNLRNCRGSGNTIFQAIGMPTDADMFAASRRHEDRHATDFIQLSVDNFFSWNLNLDVASALNTPFHGRTKAEATSALFSAMGGTPEEIINRYVVAVVAAIDAYHSTPAGGAVSFDGTTATANQSCTTSSVECTNPS